MNENTDLKVPHHTYAALLAMLHKLDDRRSPAHVAALAIEAWIAAAAKPAPSGQMRGYQWKSLFLPEGTKLRMLYKGTYSYASVRGDVIDFQGWAYSPRQFTMRIAGSVRNAWRELWIRCPGDERWHLADTRRRILRRGLAPTQPSPSAPPEPPAPSASARSPDAAAYGNALAAIAAVQARHDARFLHRDDIVRDDQPDLGRAPPGMPRGNNVPGRRGPPERRRDGRYVIKVPPGWENQPEEAYFIPNPALYQRDSPDPGELYLGPRQ